MSWRPSAPGAWRAPWDTTPKPGTVGAIFDLGKDILLVVVLHFWRRRSLGFVAGFGVAWICLVALSGLATHSTVTTAISTIERSGTWKMEVRSNAKAELQQLATLSRPSPPRPATTVREALAATRVPPAIWKNSNECNGIREARILLRRAPMSCSCVATWRPPSITSVYRRGQPSCGRCLLRLRSYQRPTRSLHRSTLPRWLPIEGTDGVPLLTQWLSRS